MKRSEAIEILQASILKHISLSDILETEEVMLVMQDIEDHIQMSPPPLCDCKSEACFEATLNVWESEDE